MYQDKNLTLKEHVFMQIIGFEWMKSPFPFSEFINKANYLLDKKDMRKINTKIQKILNMTKLDMAGIDQICKNQNQNAFIYIETPYNDIDTGNTKISRKKMSVIDLNMVVYNDIITPIHRYLKDWGKKELDL